MHFNSEAAVQDRMVTKKHVNKLMKAFDKFYKRDELLLDEMAIVCFQSQFQLNAPSSAWAVFNGCQRKWPVQAAVPASKLTRTYPRL